MNTLAMLSERPLIAAAKRVGPQCYKCAAQSAKLSGLATGQTCLSGSIRSVGPAARWGQVATRMSPARGFNTVPIQLITASQTTIIRASCLTANGLLARRHNSTKASDGDKNEKIDFDKSERAAQASQVNLSAKLTPASQGTGGRREIRRLMGLVRTEKGPLAAAMCLLVVSVAVSLTLPRAIGDILDAINTPGSDKCVYGIPLNQFLAGLSGLFVIGAGAIYGRTMLLRIIGERVVSKLRARIFKQTIQQDAEFFDANRVGDLISRLGTDAAIVSRSVTQNLADGLRSTLTAVAGVGMMSYTSLYLTGIIMVILPPVLVGTWFYGRKVRQISRNFQMALGGLTRVSEERFSNVRTAQAFAGETQEIRLYNEKVREVFNIAKTEARANGIFFSTVQLTGNFVIIGLLALGVSLVDGGSLTFGQLTSYMMYTAYAGSAAGGVGNFYSELMKGAGAASRLFEILDRRPTINPSTGAKLANPNGSVVFDRVSFSYPTRPAIPIFEDLSFEIKPGKHVCIVGPSGSGKSTVTSLLLRFYDPKSGAIRIGDQDLSGVSVKNLRRHIGVVSQEPVLFSGTIAENIAYANPHATRAEILDVAKRANASFIADFPDGLDTAVGPRGAQLSGGQKQRIAIARAMIKKPSILILDEATSALDVESEALVNEALVKAMQPKVTTISIAHRLSTISRSDEVIVLANGRVAEHGNFYDLYRDPDSALSKLLQQRKDVLEEPKEHDDQPDPPKETEDELDEEVYEVNEALERALEQEQEEQQKRQRLL